MEKEHKAFVHHRLRDGTNIWQYRGRTFVGTPDGWIADGDLFSKTFEGIKSLIDMRVDVQQVNVEAKI